MAAKSLKKAVKSKPDFELLVNLESWYGEAELQEDMQAAAAAGSEP